MFFPNFRTEETRLETLINRVPSILPSIANIHATLGMEGQAGVVIVTILVGLSGIYLVLDMTKYAVQLGRNRH